MIWRTIWSMANVWNADEKRIFSSSCHWNDVLSPSSRRTAVIAFPWVAMAWAASLACFAVTSWHAIRLLLRSLFSTFHFQGESCLEFCGFCEGKRVMWCWPHSWPRRWSWPRNWSRPMTFCTRAVQPSMFLFLSATDMIFPASLMRVNRNSTVKMTLFNLAVVLVLFLVFARHQSQFRKPAWIFDADCGFGPKTMSVRRLFSPPR